MADKPADIAVRVGADITGLTTGLGKARGELRSFGSAADGLSSKMGALGIAAGAAAVGIGALVSAQMEAITTNRDFALQLDTTTNSVTALKRAADLAGISQGAIESASKKLSITLAQAADGTGKAAETLERLGLTASELQALPLDERITRINQAIATNIPATERAAVAAQLFGKNVANSIQLLTPETIAQANREIEAFGLKVSEVDAAALDAADESMQRFAMAAKGGATTIATELAPRLTALGEALLDNAEKTGGFANEIKLATDIAVASAVTIADGFSWIGKMGSMTWNNILDAMYEVEKGYTRLELRLARPLFGGQFTNEEYERAQKLVDQIHELERAQTALRKENEATIQGPNLSEEFEKRVAAARESAKEEAALQKTLADAKAQAALDGIKKEQDGRAAADAKELESARDKAAKLAEIERKKSEQIIARQIQERQAKEESLSSGLEAIRAAHADELEQIEMKYEQERQIIEEARATNNELALQSAGLMEQIEFDKQQAIKKIQDDYAEQKRQREEAERQFTVSKTADALAAVGELMSTGNKRQFELSKKLGLAAAAISMYQGIAQALTYGNPVAVAAGVAYATATGLKSIQQIKAQQYGGGASGGGVGAPRLPTDTNVPGTAATGGGGNTQNIYVRGINPNQFFSGQQLLDLINAARDNGGNLRTA